MVLSVSLGEGDGTPLLYSGLENPMDGGAWYSAVHGVAKSQTRLSNFPFTFHFHALEKEMATHSSVPAWRIPGMGEPGGLRPMGLNSRTRLKQLSSSSSLLLPLFPFLGQNVSAFNEHMLCERSYVMLYSYCLRTPKTTQ